jgi:hypothetical protein
MLRETALILPFYSFRAGNSQRALTPQTVTSSPMSPESPSERHVIGEVIPSGQHQRGVVAEVIEVGIGDPTFQFHWDAEPAAQAAVEAIAAVIEAGRPGHIDFDVKVGRPTDEMEYPRTSPQTSFCFDPSRWALFRAAVDTETLSSKSLK